MLLSRKLEDFARPICKSVQMCARAIYCGCATKFPVWKPATFTDTKQTCRKQLKITKFTINKTFMIKQKINIIKKTYAKIVLSFMALNEPKICHFL